jgi:antitoxin (DNA-binding transcriptional repressor) of toxin-antitoxin stability system
VSFELGIVSEKADIPCMQTLSLSEAQQHLTELVRGLTRDSELVITDADKPVAKLSPMTARTSLRDLSPKSVGAVLRPFPSPEDDTLGEMLDARP